MSNQNLFDNKGFREFQGYAFSSAIFLLIEIGIEKYKGSKISLIDLRKSLGIIADYERLFEEVIRQLAVKNYIHFNNGQLEITEKLFQKAKEKDLSVTEKELIANYPYLDNHLELLNTCVKNFTAILKGEKLATNVMFPNGSMHLVEGVYKGNPSSDYLNDILSDKVSAYVSQNINKTRSAKEHKIRILEIGAGTGGTSASVFQKLKPFKEHLEYTYTDLSKSFLIHAEKTYKSVAPYLETALLDVEKPVALQGFEKGSYDIIIAANVLHATKDIANTLVQTKSLLKSQGLLLLNEISKTEMYTTLTFGLLEGWWLYEDEELREEGSPALSIENWSLALGEQGLDVEEVLPDSEEFSQKIIIAKGDGHIFSEDTTKPLQQVNSGSFNTSSEEAYHKKSSIDQKEDRFDSSTDTIEEQLIVSVSEVLNIPLEEVMLEDAFSDYGLDSILGAKFLKSINDSLQIELEITDIFNYPNIKKLAAFVNENHVITNSNVSPVSADESISLTEPELQPVAASNSEYIEKQLIASVSEVLNIPLEEVMLEDAFSDYGLDSILGAKFLKSINEKLQIELEITDVFNYPNIKKLGNYINDSFSVVDSSAVTVNREITEKPIPEVAENVVSINKVRHKEESTSYENTEAFKAPITTNVEKNTENDKDEIAIVGISGQFGATSNLEEFWKAIEKGESLITEVPKDRWDTNTYFSADRSDKNKTYSKWGSFIKDIDKFDPMFFKISGKEAENMDPQQRIFLEHCWKAIEDAAILPSTLSESKCGVFVSAAPSDYRSHLKQQDVSSFSGTANSILAARISYLLNLKGPALTVDTACSSSLVAMHLGYNSLKSGESDVILAGGVHLQSTPGFYINASRAGMLSPTGKCYSFDNRADGFVPGEGVGIVIMKRLKDAVAAGDHIYGLIKGSGINQDGTTNGIMAPNGLAQKALESEVFSKFKINPESIGYVEAHGTGTLLGDPVEFKALNQSFKEHTNRVSYCGLGSVKSNIGHSIMAAGVAGIIKVLLAMKYKKIPIACNFEKLNDNISLNNSPFYINTQSKDWETQNNQPRRAAVSSFGFSGTNAHMVLEAYNQELKEAKPQINTPVLVPISAKNPERLKEYVHSFVELLTTNVYSEDKISLENMAWTMQIGRKAMDERMIVIASSTEELLDNLKNYLDSNLSNPSVFSGNIRDQDNSSLKNMMSGASGALYIKEVIREKDFKKLSQLWIEGLDIPWKAMYTNGFPKKISLPSYPFARESYWLPDAVLPNIEDANTIVSTNQNDLGTVYISPKWRNQEIVFDVAKDYSKKYVILTQELQYYEAKITDAEVIVLNENAPEYCFSTVFDLIKKEIDNNIHVSIVLVCHTKDWVKYGFIASLFSTVKIETPNIKAKIVGIDLHSEESVLGIINKERNDSAIAIQYSSSGRKVKQLEEITLEEKNRDKIIIKNNGVFLITGGMGGLGKLFASHLVETYKDARVILTGRSAIKGEYVSTLKNLKRAEYYPCDVSDKAEVASLIAHIKNTYGQLNGIIHAAGVGTMSLIKDAKEKEERNIFPAKVNGVINLDEATKSEALDFVVYFSSISSIVGIQGMSHYAAANAYMDAFSAYRNELVFNGERQGKTLSIHWPFWQEGGMQINETYTEALFHRFGTKVLPKEIGISGFEYALKQAESQLLIAYGDPTLIRKKILFNRKKNKSAANEQDDHRKIESLKKDLIQFIIKEIASILKIDQKVILVDMDFGDFGFDSISLTELSNRLNKKFDLELVPTIFYNYSTIKLLIEYLFSEYDLQANSIFLKEEVATDTFNSKDSKIKELESPKNRSIVSSKTETNNNNIDEPIAIIGMSGRYPGAADVTIFWNKLKEGKDLVTEVPADRWDWKQYYGDPQGQSEKTKVKWGGFIEDIDKFDPLFFNISPKEAKLMDPQQRLCLESVWSALEDAGIKGSDIAGTDAGIYIGVSATDYATLMQNEKLPPNGHVTTGTSLSMLVNRISYFLDIHGPSEPVDTACSSSLVAINKAVDSIRSGRSTLAIAGGVNAQLTPAGVLALSKAGMLSTEGKCKTFDAEANGYVRSEGVGMLILKKLSDAEADGDYIHGVIKATAQNHGGKSNSLTAPNPKAQKELLVSAYKAAGITPDQISYIETHGTGTSLGDPIEIDGLKMAFQELHKTSGRKEQSSNCALGTVKTNVGHLESAAGVVSVAKVLLAMKHNYLPGNIHLHQVNPYIKIENTPFELLKEGKPWGNDKKKIAGISGFGFGGVNAHIVLEEYKNKSKDFQYPDMLKIIPISAKNKHRLKDRVQQLVVFLRNINSENSSAKSDEINIHNIAWTLQVGREPMEERLILMVHTLEELLLSLADYINGNITGKDNVFEGSIETLENEAIPEDNILENSNIKDQEIDPNTIAQLWVNGTVINWSKLYKKGTPQKINLPSYPFERTRYWFDKKTIKNIPVFNEENSLRQAVSLSNNQNTFQKQKVVLSPLTANAIIKTEEKPLKQPVKILSKLSNNMMTENIQNTTQNNPKETNLSKEAIILKLKQLLSEALSIDSSQLKITQKFVDLGLDSILGVELVKEINTELALNLSATDLYDYPTIDKLSDFLSQKITENTNGNHNTETPEKGHQIEPLRLKSVILQQEVIDAPITTTSQHNKIQLKNNLEASKTPNNELISGIANKLIKLLCEATDLEQYMVNPDQKFIDLGLDSILGVELVKEINKEFNLNISATDLYDYPTLNQLKVFIASSLDVADEVSIKQEFSTSQTNFQQNKEGVYGYAIEGVQQISETTIKNIKLTALGADEVQIEVKASGVNFPDIMCVKGMYPAMPNYPFVPGFEVSGIVTKIGNNVSNVEVGDAVIALTGWQMGGHASHVNAHSISVVKKPKNITFEEASSLPVIFITIYHALKKAKLKAGEHILIQTAAGGCGLMATQLVNLIKANPVGTSSRPIKISFLNEIGMMETANYKDSNFEVSMQQKHQGFDVVLNMLSGNMIQKGLNLLKPGGRYVELAVHGLKTSADLDMSGLIDNHEFISINLRTLGNQGKLDLEEALTMMTRLIEEESIVPPVSRTYPISAIKEAMEWVETGAHIGKIVISHQQTQIIDNTENLIHSLKRQKSLVSKYFPESTAPLTNNNSLLKSIKKEKQEIPKIAIIGMSGKFPGSPDVDSFWQNLADGKDLVTEAPIERWDVKTHYSNDPKAVGKTYCKWGGFIDDIDQFDPLFFNISPAEAESMDPQQRLFLEESWKTFEDAGYAPKMLSGSKCGVFVGAVPGDYNNLHGNKEEVLDYYTLAGSTSSILSARISYILDLKGPCLSIDTACSSSLVAIAQACENLVSNTCDMALAGGVFIATTPGTHIMTSKAGMLSTDGKCHTFDQNANGFVPGEGIGLVLLKRLDDAIKDNDNIVGVVNGWGVNQDGATNGITAPSVESQIQLETDVYEKFNIDPSEISYVEAHGTGTKLGDPIELKGLTRSFRKFTDKKQFCGIGSVKTNIGHAQTASGAASLIKVLLALKNEKIPPSLHFNQLNEHINLEDSPFFVTDTIQDWKLNENASRKAAISSFGFSGTNAHLVIEDYVPVSVNEVSTVHKVLIPVSAKDKHRLQEYTRSLLSFLEVSQNASLKIEDIAWTLQTGREPMGEKVAFVVESIEDFTRKLRAYNTGEEQVKGVYEGKKQNNGLVSELFLSGEEGALFVQQILKDKNYGKLANLWVLGIDFDWRLLYGKQPKRVSLPSYPFAKERYWLETINTNAKVSNFVASSNNIHPLVHKNETTAKTIRFASHFDGLEAYFIEHIVLDEYVLPGVAHLEMARFAGGISTETKINRITDIVWGDTINSVKKDFEVFVDFNKSEGNSLSYEIYSEPNNKRNFHSQGRVHSEAYLEPVPPIDVEAILGRSKGELTEEQCYGIFDSVGLELGRIFRCIKWLKYNDKESLTFLELQHSEAGIDLHIGMLDAALQTVVGCFMEKDLEEVLALPFSVQEVKIHAPLVDKVYCYARLSSKYEHSDKIRSYDVDITDTSGKILLEVKDYVLRKTKSQKTETSDRSTLYLTTEWNPKELASFSLNENNVDTNKLVLVTGAEKAVVNAISLHGRDTEIIAIPQTTSEKYWEAVFVHIQNIISFRKETQVMVLYPVTEWHRYSFISGLLKTAQMENPLISGKTIAVTEQMLQSSSSLLDAITKEFTQVATEVRYLSSGREVKEIKEKLASNFSGLSSTFKTDDVYLITGGMGGLGKIFAEHISKTKGSQLVLIGRSLLNEDQKQWIEKYKNITYRTCDISDKNAAQNIVNTIKTNYGKLNGIIHSAGALRDNFIIKKKVEDARAVLSAKIQGTINLDEATRKENLDVVIYFSSVAAITGNVGQSDYAAANAFMDNYAVYRNQLVVAGKCTGKTISINWPLWEEGSMTVGPESAKLAEKDLGIVALPTTEGIAIMDGIMQANEAQVAIYHGHIHKLRKFVFATKSKKAVDFNNAEINKLPSNEPIKAPLKQGQNNSLNVNSIEANALSYLTELLSANLKISKYKLQPDKPFEQYGIDSIMVIKLTNVLEEQFGILPKTLFFEYMNLEELSAYFSETYPEKIEEISKVQGTWEIEEASSIVENTHIVDTEIKAVFQKNNTYEPIAVKEEKKVEEEDVSKNDIAIIGLSGRYPQANTVNEFWENLKEGKDCITEIPKDRWDMDQYYDPVKGKEGKICTKYGGFIDGVGHFDPLFFNISPIEAELMDPQERLFLESAWEAVEDAGYTRKTLQSSTAMDGVKGNVGVYVGVMYEEYPFFGVEGAIKGKSLVVSSNSSSIANRVSYFLDIKGPSMAVNTMCSSSLTSIHLASESLLNGTCKMAIAGGVNVNIHPNKFLMLSQGGFISQKGRCASFGNEGDGYTPSEGVGAVLLKPLAQAKLDGDRIYGVIKGSSLNHGGKTNGYTVPNPKAQAVAIKSALKKSKLPAESLSYIEAHGTGTSLGDPIEISGLSQAFNKGNDTSCSIGSVKSNIGHTESAAGIAGVTKVLLQMKHKQLAPSIHSSTLNANIDFNNGPFKVQQNLMDWKKPVVYNDNQYTEYKRLAGISSFGAGGSNAHIIIEEYLDADIADNAVLEDEKVMICLSAKNTERLQSYVYSLQEFLKNEEYQTVSSGLIEGAIITSLASITDIPKEELDINSSFKDLGIGQLVLVKLLDVIKSEITTDISLQQILDSNSILEIVSILKNQTEEVSSKPTQLRMQDIAWTLQIGREAMEERLVIIASNIDELQQGLHTYLQKENKNAQAIYTGNIEVYESETSKISQGEEWENYVSSIVKNKNYDKIAQLWIEGVAINWQELYIDKKPKRIGLPTYSFAKNYYWFPAPRIEEKPVVMDKLHSLVHHNLSNFEEQCYSSVFTGQESFLKDHIVQGEKVLPGVAYIEMARVAGTMSLAQEITQIKDVVWNIPFSITKDSQELSISLYKDKSASISYEIYSEAQQKELVHSQGKLTTTKLSKPEALPLEELKRRCAKTITKENCYQLFDSLGLKYGTSFQCMETLSYNAKESLSFIRLQVAEKEAFVLHSGMMDAALQTILGLSLEKKDGSLSLPFSVGEINIYSKLPEGVYCYARLAKGAKETDRVVQYDIDIVDYSGEVVVSLRNFAALQVDTDKKELEITDVSETLSMIPSWKEIPAQSTISIKAEKQLVVLTNELSDLEKVLEKELDLDKIIVLEAGTSEDYYYQIFDLIKSEIRSETSFAIQVLCPLEDWQKYGFISGLLKTAQMENPKVQPKIIGIEKEYLGSADVLSELFRSEQLDRAIEVHYKNGNRFIPMLQEIEIEDAQMPVAKAEGVYLITGGMGGLGKVFASYLDQTKGVKLILTGRSNLDEKREQILKEFQQAEYRSCDIGSKDAVISLIESIKRKYGKIDGIIHSAGVLKDSFIVNKEKELSGSVLTPKIPGTLYLDQATKLEALDFMVYFSSMAAVTGNIGQADYAAANAYLDNYAVYRESLRNQGKRSGKTYSINWPLWEAGGMHMDSDSTQLLSSYGFNPLPNAEGIAVFKKIMNAANVQSIISYGDKTKMLAVLLANQKNTQEKVVVNNTQKNAPTNSLFEALQSQIVAQIAGMLKLKDTDINPEKELSTYGLDSMMVTRFSNQLADMLQVELIPTVLFNYPTIAKLTGYLITEYGDHIKDNIKGAITEGNELQEASSNKLPIENGLSKVQNELIGQVALMLKLEISTINPNKELSTYGFDSMMVTKFSNQINTMYGIELIPTVLFNYPTLALLAEHIVSEYGNQILYSKETIVPDASELLVTANQNSLESGLRIRKPRKRRVTGTISSYGNEDTAVLEKPVAASKLLSAEAIDTPIKEEKIRKLNPYIVPISTTGNKPPIFIIPGVVGDCIGYMGLGHSLGYDGPIYGLNVKGTLSEDDIPYSSMQEMAKHHLNLIDSLDYSGPIRLMSHSFGVLVMYEMLKQLEGQNIEIDKIIMIDGIPELIKGKISVTESIKVFLTAVNGNKNKIDVEVLAKKVVKKPKKNRLDFLIEELTKIDFLKEEDYSLFKKLYRITLAGVALDYVPDQSLPYNVIAIKADDGLHKSEEFKDKDVNWDPYFKTVKVINSPGNHFSVADKPLCNEWIDKIDWK